MAYLIVTIDTEEDNWGEYDRASYSVENIARIPRLHEIFLKYGVRPTYLVTYPVATDRRSIDILSARQLAGECEIGTHIHPWNTPPVTEQKSARHSFISNLAADLQRRKIQTLHDTIAMNFAVRPTSYRSGRWGFDSGVAQVLIDLGYAVDTSVYPRWDWTDSGGPDFRTFTLEPFVYATSAGHGAQPRRLLEVPATIDFLQTGGQAATSAYWLIKRAVPASDKVLAGLNKLGVLSHVCLSPELALAGQMAALSAALLRRGTTVLNMFFHSASLLPGCSPFVRTEKDADAFLGRIDEYLGLTLSLGLRPATLSELTATGIGAAREQRLPESRVEQPEVNR